MTYDCLEGYVSAVIFRNEENGYTVFSFVQDDEEYTCVGFMEAIKAGETMKVRGHFTEHSVYGWQLKVEKYEITVPEDRVAIERYLGSGAIRGIGEKFAHKIVMHFGEDTLSIIRNEPERLAEIKGISIHKAQDIASQISEQEDIRDAMIFLQGYGISLNLGLKVYKAYGQGMYSILKENPYKLAEDIEGIGFKSADEIASRIGISFDSEFRIRAAALYLLTSLTSEGSVYLPRPVLEARIKELTGVNDDAADQAIDDLVIERKIIIKTRKQENNESLQAVYLAQNYYVELSVARRLADLNVICEENEKKIAGRIEKLNKKSKVKLEGEQLEAVRCAVKYGLFVLTGGPGTGKTTTINEIIRYYRSEGLEVMLAAPTGRAAKRMTETSDYEASTIHRLLEVGPLKDDEGRGSFRFEKNEDNPLETDVLIIDEMSMIDIFLMDALLKALLPGTRLILAGDADQLPSVGAGRVLEEIIASKRVPTVKLNKIFRQAELSDIVMNAHRINRGEQPKIDNKSRDFFFLERTSSNMIISNIIELIQKKLPKYVDAGMSDIQVLSPMRKGQLGIERLNRILQRYLNPPSDEKREIQWEKGIFREGDKVMQIRNDYELEWEERGLYGIVINKGSGVFNGDLGIVRLVDDFSKILTVEFDENKFVSYSFEILDELELAYATTIHKSQGSEYPAVIIPLLPGPKQLYTRNLLYTAVTRARKCVVILGSREVLNEMTANASEQGRYTSLKEAIEEISDLE